MAVLVHCYCGKDTQVPESFCGQPGECPNCKIRYTLPASFAELGRPILPPDLSSSTIIVLHCTCGANLEVQLKYSGKKVKCKNCGNVMGVPTLKIPESNYIGEEGKYWAERGEAVKECKRCGYPIYEADKFCTRCGAHPDTGLTAPEAEDVWIEFSQILLEVFGTGTKNAPKRVGSRISRTSSYPHKLRDKRDKSGRASQRSRARKSRPDKRDRRK